MSGVDHITVKGKDAGQRLDRWFRHYYPQVTHGQLQKLLRKGQIRVNGGRAAADRRLEAGETVRIPPFPPSAAHTKPPLPREGSVSPADEELIHSIVLYDKDDLLAVNKPFGLAVQAGAKVNRHLDGMLPVLAHDGETPRLVHRLDRDTGGLMILGRTRAMAAHLAEAFKQHRILKTYWALTKRVPHPPQGRIDLSLEKAGAEGHQRMRGTAEGQKAITDYQVVEEAARRAAFVALRPHTGRTHQIRVHLSALRTPIIGDRKYGGADAMVEGVSPKMHLFCRSMEIPLPNGKRIELSAPLTGHMAETWALFDFAEPELLEWPE